MNKADVKDRESALKYTLSELEKFKKKHQAEFDIEPLDEGGYHVSVPMEFFNEICVLQNKLNNMGIWFDTGAGFGFRDWELDWSFSYEPQK